MAALLEKMCDVRLQPNPFAGCHPAQGSVRSIANHDKWLRAVGAGLATFDATQLVRALQGRRPCAMRCPDFDAGLDRCRLVGQLVEGRAGQC